MHGVEKDSRLGSAVVGLADLLVEDFDVVEVATRLVHLAVDLTGAHSAGLLIDGGQGLRLLAATSEEAKVVETFQVQGDDGPCIDAFHQQQPVSADDADEIRDRWPHFARAAEVEGITSVFATPLRLRGDVIGSLNLFLTRPGSLDAGDRRRADAVADLATIAISQAHAARSHGETARQLQSALDSRVVIEQAKGVLLATTGGSVDDAFRALRTYARSTNRRLADVAGDVVERRLDTDELLRASARAPRST